MCPTRPASPRSGATKVYSPRGTLTSPELAAVAVVLAAPDALPGLGGGRGVAGGGQGGEGGELRGWVDGGGEAAEQGAELHPAAHAEGGVAGLGGGARLGGGLGEGGARVVAGALAGGRGQGQRRPELGAAVEQGGGQGVGQHEAAAGGVGVGGGGGVVHDDLLLVARGFGAPGVEGGRVEGDGDDGLVEVEAHARADGQRVHLGAVEPGDGVALLGARLGGEGVGLDAAATLIVLAEEELAVGPDVGEP
ncbi:hypothetical protein FH972_021552 [Carpinus fangiana]|uniref:Uncharacterized protein n=1 Tax=Carpinus fangiana TaxID=176857 RepID=A0A5N6KQB4_9ROSI|nr:hypothetical protein FH972_021552 [Carpinus fangiana]